MAESAPERLTRLLTLVPWLAAHSGVSKAEAARHFDLTVAQLESDLQLITFTGPGLYGGELVDIAFDDETISVYDVQGLDRPLELSVDESAALLVGLAALQQLPDMDAALIARVMDKLAPYAAAGADLDIRVQPSPHAATIAEAIRAGRDLDLVYVHPLRDEAEPRRVTPLAVLTRDGVDYLNAWCHRAEAMRTFRLDRMEQCALGAATDTTPASAAAVQAPSLPAHAVVQVQASAEHLLEGVQCTVLERDEDLLVRVDYSDELWLVSWVIAAGGRARVVEPTSARDAVGARVGRSRDAYAQLAQAAHSAR